MRDSKDFYIVWEGHPKYKEGEIVTDERIRVIVQKIEMVLFTNKGDCIADIDFGADITRYLWETNVSTDFIRNEIIRQFDTYIPELELYDYSVELELLRGTIRDILIINVYVNELLVGAQFS